MGTSHRTIETPVFKFDQLSDKAKARALANNRDRDVDHGWWEQVYDDAVIMAGIMGIDIACRKGSSQPAIFFSGFSSQGDGACFEGDYSYKKGALKELKSSAPAGYKDQQTKQWVVQEANVELHRICKSLQDVQRTNFYRLEATVVQSGHYYHSGCTRIEVTNTEGHEVDLGAEEDIKQLLRDFMDWIYDRLETEHDYLTSDAHVEEALQDDEFTEEGDRV